MEPTDEFRAIHASARTANLQHQNEVNAKLDDIDARLQNMANNFLTKKQMDDHKDANSGIEAQDSLFYNHMEKTLKTAEGFVSRSRTMANGKLFRLFISRVAVQLISYHGRRFWNSHQCLFGTSRLKFGNI
jgi:hypothetical protein